MIQTPKRETLESLISLIFELQNKTRPHENLDKDQALAKLIKLAAEWGLKTEPESSNFLPDLLDEAIRRYFKSPEQQPASIPPNITELVEIYDKAEQEKKDRLEKSIASQKELEKYKSFVDRFKKVITTNTTKELPPKLVEQMAENAANKIITFLPVVAQSDYFPKEDEKQLEGKIEEVLQNELKKVGEELKIAKTPDEEKIAKEDKKIIEAEAIKIAAEPQIIEAVKERPLVKEVLIDLKKLSLPPEIIKQIESQVIKETYSPLKTILDPQASLALTKRTFYTLQAKAIQMKVAEIQVPTEQKEAFKRFKKMVYQGLFKEDLQATLGLLEELGLSENHEAFKYLNSEINALDEIQKVDIKNWLGKIVGRGDHPYIKILKKYYDFGKKTGKWQVFDKNLNVFLKLSPDVLWANKKGYSFLVKRLVDKFQFLPNFYQKTFQFITRGHYNSLGGWTQKFVYGKVLKPLFAKISQTAAGQTVKAGVKKAAGWLATKMGIKFGIWAAAAGTTAPSLGTSLLIATVVEFLGKIKNFIVSLFRDPGKALGSAGVGVLLLVFAPMPFALIGIVPLVLGGSGLISFALAPATLGAIGGGVGAFFTAISTLPFILPVVAFVVTLLSVVAGLTFFIVMVVSGAFVLPQKVSETTPTTISPYESEYFSLTKTAEPSTLDNSDLGKTEIEYTVKIEAKKENKLTISDITETISVQTAENKVLNVAPYDFTKDLAGDNEVSLGKPLIIKYTIKPPTFFADSAIINTVNVNLAVGGNVPGSFPGTASAIVVIGNPPIACPSGWPFKPEEAPEAYISQGPNTSGPRASHQGDEAIDISLYTGTPVYATHEGRVVDTYNDGAGGKTVEIRGTCNGVEFTSKYFHLNSFLVSKGQLVTQGSLIAQSDNTGSRTSGAHLDYRFINLKMKPPYIPVDVSGCIGRCYEF